MSRGRRGEGASVSSDSSKSPSVEACCSELFAVAGAELLDLCCGCWVSGHSFSSVSLGSTTRHGSGEITFRGCFLLSKLCSTSPSAVERVLKHCDHFDLDADRLGRRRTQSKTKNERQMQNCVDRRHHLPEFWPPDTARGASVQLAYRTA